MNPDDAAQDDDPAVGDGSGAPGGVPQVSDEEWAELVSRMMDDPGDDPREPLSWPSDGETDQEDGQAPSPGAPPAARPDAEPEGHDDPFAEFAEPVSSGLSAFPTQPGGGFRGSESSLLDAPEEGYEPPEPPPIDLSTSSPFLVLSWFCALAGPAYVLFVVLFWRHAPEYTVLIGVGAFVAGLIGLGMHLPTRHDDNDDGAVV